MRVTTESFCGSADDGGALVCPHFWVNVAAVFRNHVQRHIELALLRRKLVIRHRGEPDIDVEPDLMAGMAAGIGPPRGCDISPINSPFHPTFFALSASLSIKATKLGFPQ